MKKGTIFSALITLMMIFTSCGTKVAKRVPKNDFHTLEQYQYSLDDYKNIYSYCNGEIEKSSPRGIKCNFNGVSDSKEYYIEKANNKEFIDSYIYKSSKKEFFIQNSKLGELIFYRISTNEKDLSSAKVREVKVSSLAPRNIYLDGVSNIRDIGGWSSTLVPGAFINQGLFYRSARLDTISQIGKDILINELYVDTEIDMRDDFQCTGPYISQELGDIKDVNYVIASIPSGTEKDRFFGYNDVWKLIFTEIANQKGAIVLHCTAGADRTGLAAYFLLTLLGVSYEDVARDYLYTNFSNQGIRYIDDLHLELWEDSLLYYPGNTRAERCKNALLSKGITNEQIETIRKRYINGY